jgi:hypothetical protein
MPYPPQGSGGGGGSGSGDMTKAVYDADTDNVVDESEETNAVKTSGSLPSNVKGKVIYLTSDDHVYVST